MNSILIQKQTKVLRKIFTEDRQRYLLIVTLRYDDDCKNGHNTFSMTGEVWKANKDGQAYGRDCKMCGCLHDTITKHFPELAQYIKWHLCSSDGPMYYIEKTVHLASERDCWGLLKDERKQIVNGRTKLPAWEMFAQNRQTYELVPLYELNKTQDAEQCPVMEYDLIWHSWDNIGEGKARELDDARSSAIWPDASDEDLIAPGLKDRLTARLPKLMEEFQQAMEALGFIY